MGLIFVQTCLELKVPRKSKKDAKGVTPLTHGETTTPLVCLRNRAEEHETEKQTRGRRTTWPADAGVRAVGMWSRGVRRGTRGTDAPWCRPGQTALGSLLAEEGADSLHVLGVHLLQSLAAPGERGATPAIACRLFTPPPPKSSIPGQLNYVMHTPVQWM